MPLELGNFGEQSTYIFVEDNELLERGFRKNLFFDEFRTAEEEWSKFCSQKLFRYLIEDEILNILNEFDLLFRIVDGTKEVEWSGKNGRVKVNDYTWAEILITRFGLQILGEPPINLTLFPEYWLNYLRCEEKIEDLY